MKWFRKMYLTNIYNKIHSGKENFCCIASKKTIYSLFICWKNLKEVKENMNSTYLTTYISNYSCKMNRFNYKTDRLSFLKECLTKFN